jgi:hypothetical protein
VSSRSSGGRAAAGTRQARGPKNGRDRRRRRDASATGSGFAPGFNPVSGLFFASRDPLRRARRAGSRQ